MNILVLGAGAVGGTLGGYLARAGRSVTIADPWARQIETVRAHGVRVQSPDEEFQVEVPVLHIDELPKLGHSPDVLIIATKAYDTEWAYKLAREYLGENSVVLSAQNGVVEELLPRYADMSKVLGCVVNFAAECFEPGFVRRTMTGGWPSLTVGELDGKMTSRLADIAALLEPVGQIISTDNIRGHLWSKLVLNTMTNGTGALTGATTKTLWGDTEQYVPVAVAAGAETAAVANALGVSLEPAFGRVDASVLVGAYKGDRDSADEVASVLTSIAAERSGARENKPSMLQDILKGRRTEIEYLNGFVERHGASFQLSVPMNGRIAELVRDVDAGVRQTDPANISLLASVLT